MLWRSQKSTSHKLGARLCQRAPSKRQNRKRGRVTIIVFLGAPAGHTALHLRPKRLSNLETGPWPLAAPCPAGECEDSVISFTQLLLRNSRPATGPRTWLKINSGFQTQSSVCRKPLLVRVGPEGLCRSPLRSAGASDADAFLFPRKPGAS